MLKKSRFIKTTKYLDTRIFFADILLQINLSDTAEGEISLLTIKSSIFKNIFCLMDEWMIAAKIV